MSVATSTSRWGVDMSKIRIIRSLQDPLLIKAYGYVGPGGLGEFDPSLWEEVEGELPDGYVMWSPKSLYDRCKALMDAEWIRQAEHGVVATPAQVQNILGFQAFLRDACNDQSMYMVNTLIGGFVIDGLDLEQIRLALHAEAEKGWLA